MAEFTFDGQRADEEVILFRHQHPWVLAKMGFIDVALAVAILAMFLIFGASSLSVISLILGVIIISVYNFNKIYSYRNTFFILTDQRIMNINQGTVFGRKVQETELVNIYNLSYSTKGIIKNLLNFGEIELTTQGDVNDRIIFKNMPVPHEIFEKLSKARKAAMDKLDKTERAFLR
jgi:hypothetical protein